MERPLLLHSSALSDQEYAGYTRILNDLIPSQDSKHDPQRGRTAPPIDDVNAKQVPLGETRGWIRGKYGLDSSLIDQVAAYFKSNLPRPDTLDAPQLFAFLRLLSHGAGGQGVDRALVFVQASSPLGYPGSPQKSPTLIDARHPAAAPPMPPRSLPQSRSRTPIDRSPERMLPPVPPPKHDHTPKPPSTHNSPVPGSNPFRRSYTAQHPSATSSTSSFHVSPLPPTPSRTAPIDDDVILSWSSDRQHTSGNQPTDSKPAGATASDPSAFSWRKQSVDDITPPTFPSTNPFLSRSKSTTSTHHRTSNVVDLNPISPPLPPRKPLAGTKPSVQPPPRHPAPPPKPSASTKPSQSTSTNHSHSSTGSNLIRQSLIAAKTAQKASEHSLEKIKTWEIIKSSSSGGSIKSRHAAANSKDATSGDDQLARPGVSPPSSSSSLEHVATAKVPSAPASILSGHIPNSRPAIPGKPPRPDLLSRSTSPVKIQSTAVLSDPSSLDNAQPSAPADSPLGSPALSTTSTNSPPITASRTTRSKSLHNPSPNRPPVPPLPPARKRPESIQVLSSPFAASATNSATSQSSGLPSASLNSTPLSRRTSLHRSPGHGHSQSLSSTATTASSTAAESINSLYSSFKNNTRALLHQNEFEKLVGKAEGGLVPGRGYLKSRGAEGERLVDTRDTPDTDLIGRIEDEDEDVEVTKERERLNALRLDKGPPLKPTSNTTTTTSVLESDSDDDGGASAGMDSGEWEGWDRTKPRTTNRGSNTWNDANAQRRTVQAELDELKGVRSNPLVEGWRRLG